MQLLRSILVAIDGSGPSDAALAVTCSLVRQFGGMAHGCHVLATNAYLQGRHVRWLPEVEAEKRREAAAIARAAASAAATRGVDIRVAVADGDPIEEVLLAAKGVGADTIVIGNRGQNALSTLLLGSVAQGVTERSSLPVLIVHQAPEME
jgi:nucleotide-binding universal stress UspA family protein